MKKAANNDRYRARLILALAGLIVWANLAPEQIERVSAQTADAKWTYTGNLNGPRSGHTATLLLNGKVLVAGGATTAGALASAELYDPTTGIWSVTGSLNVPRYLATATLLSNGQVLIAGGYITFNSASSGPSVANTTELYDPATGIWSLTGNLNGPRAWHASTPLRNGKVLIVGGWDGSSIVNTAELYDPQTGSWSPTGNLNTRRFSHTATLLRNGKVLVVGGSDDEDFGSSLTSTELYDPNAGAWSVTGSLNTGRLIHTATILPNGDVLAAGGEGFPCSGGFCYSTVNNTAELYNPTTGTWSYTGRLSRRSNHTATLLPNGQVLVGGGANSSYDIGYWTTLNSADVYDPATGNWIPAANLNAPRYFHTATLLSNGKVLVVGGFDNSNGSLRSVELYDSGSSSFSNPIDDAQLFVRQQYLDFLNRAPDQSGWDFWMNEITSCGTDQQCVDVKRVNVAAAYFLSIEFQQTGYLVYRIYRAAYGNLPNAPVPVKFNEFLPDTQEIGHGVVVGQTGWQTILGNNKQAFSDEFVNRSRFTSAYPSSMTAADFVDKLNNNAGNPLSQTERDHVVSDLTTGAQTRAQVLRAVAENQDLSDAEFNRAVVLMQYFGYLRRNPNDAPEPTLDFQGYNFWLNKLNSFDGNFTNAEMVKAFITSTEYLQRFGPS